MGAGTHRLLLVLLLPPPYYRCELTVLNLNFSRDLIKDLKAKTEREGKMQSIPHVETRAVLKERLRSRPFLLSPTPG